MTPILNLSLNLGAGMAVEPVCCEAEGAGPPSYCGAAIPACIAEKRGRWGQRAAGEVNMSGYPPPRQQQQQHNSSSTSSSSTASPTPHEH